MRGVRIRIRDGLRLPINPSESMDGILVLTPETPIALVRVGAWQRRRLRAGDVTVVPDVPTPAPAAAPSPPPLSGVPAAGAARPVPLDDE